MIDSYILMDIITDHNLCKTQKETLQSVIDKIEKGTLKEMNYPCYVGDKVFAIVSQTSNGKNLYIIEDTVKRLSVSKCVEVKYHWLCIELQNNLGIYERDFDKVFLTREEAEKRLKELQNG